MPAICNKTNLSGLLCHSCYYHSWLGTTNELSVPTSKKANRPFLTANAIKRNKTASVASRKNMKLEHSSQLCSGSVQINLLVHWRLKSKPLISFNKWMSNGSFHGALTADNKLWFIRKPLKFDCYHLPSSETITSIVFALPTKLEPTLPPSFILWRACFFSSFFQKKNYSARLS